MKQRIGRPLFYRAYITALEDDTVYTPAAIVNNGEEHGLIPPNLQGTQRKKLRVKIRHTMVRFSKNHGFPEEGDGWVNLKGQPPMRGWYGWRWKEAAGCAG